VNIISSINEYSGFSMLIVTAILVLVTILYVYLTNRLVKESKTANDLTIDSMKKQSMVATLPHLYCGITRDSNGLVLTIYSIGNMPAYDMDNYVFGLYHEDNVGIDEFKKVMRVRELCKGDVLKANQEGFYGFYSRLVYRFFPYRKKVEIGFSLPVVPDSLYVV
jgi:hypothetical protein